MAVKKSQAADLEIVEAKLVNFLGNEPSAPMEIQDGYKIVLKRPTLMHKSKARLWTDRKFKELGLTDDEKYDLENQVTFYYTFFGALNSNVIQIITPEGDDVSFDPNGEDKGLSFLFEKFIEKDVYESDKADSVDAFLSSSTQALFEWQSETEPDIEDVKKS